MANFIDGEHPTVLAKDVVYDLLGIRHGLGFERHVVDSGYHPEGLFLVIVVSLGVLRYHLEEFGELPATGRFCHLFPPPIAFLSDPGVIRTLHSSSPGTPHSYYPK